MATKRGPKTSKLSNLKYKKSKKIDASQVRGGKVKGDRNPYLIVKLSDAIVT